MVEEVKSASSEKGPSRALFAVGLEPTNPPDSFKSQLQTTCAVVNFIAKLEGRFRPKVVINGVKPETIYIAPCSLFCPIRTTDINRSKAERIAIVEMGNTRCLMVAFCFVPPYATSAWGIYEF